MCVCVFSSVIYKRNPCLQFCLFFHATLSNLYLAPSPPPPSPLCADRPLHRRIFLSLRVRNINNPCFWLYFSMLTLTFPEFVVNFCWYSLYLIWSLFLLGYLICLSISAGLFSYLAGCVVLWFWSEVNSLLGFYSFLGLMICLCNYCI